MAARSKSGTYLITVAPELPPLPGTGTLHPLLPRGTGVLLPLLLPGTCVSLLLLSRCGVLI